MGGFTVFEFASLSRKEAANAREADNLVQVKKLNNVTKHKLRFYALICFL